MRFRSPKFEEAAVHIPEEVSHLQQAFNGTVCSNKGDEYPIENNIIDFLGEGKPRMSLAQSTNHWKAAAKLYENIWRSRSLSIFSGQSYPIEKEKELLAHWLAPETGKAYLDVGCSTALYGRAIKETEPGCEVVAIDFSDQMLREARDKAEAGHVDLYLLRTDARFMPFFGATFDGLMMGGTLNELSEPLKVLYECRRVIKKDGAMFIMHLLQAEAWYGRLFQYSTEYGGLKFWSVIESNRLFDRAGFKVVDQYRAGIVCFTKLEPQ